MYIVIILKTIFLYLFIMVGFRIMGKKEVGQLNVIDLIVSILIAELAALSLETAEQSLLKSIVPITTLILIQISLSYWSLKDSKVRTILEGRPTIIIKDGKLNFSAMAKIRYSLDDLILQLREKGYQSIEEVSFAILENNGSLSVFEGTHEYSMPLILDGVIDEVVLGEIGKDKGWLMRLLDRKKVRLENVFYAFYTKKKTFIITQDELE